MNELALFAGAGGGILGGKILGWRTICAVEYDKYAASVLVARQNDGCLEPFPIWDDVRTFDGKPWQGRVDVVSGGFPCQDISCAGTGAGLDGERSGLWAEMARIIREVRPRYVFVENSPMLTSRGLHRVLGDLAEMGFDAEWGVLGADDVGANHRRKRIWIVADASISRAQRGVRVEEDAKKVDPGSVTRPNQVANPGGVRLAKPQHKICSGWHEPYGSRENVADTNSKPRKERDLFSESGLKTPQRDNSARCSVQGWWEVEPDVGRVVDGVASRVDRLKCLGNGQVPAVAATAFKLLSERGSR